MALSKRIRFEVFKRDKFTCQYCGKKAPDVVLHVDHVVPKAEGGGDEMLNLVTACASCNLGKGPRMLSDDSVVEKQRRQLEELQERKEQIDMMVRWHQSVLEEEDHALTAAADHWDGFWDDQWTLNDHGMAALAKLIKRFSLDEVLAAMPIAVQNYGKRDGEGRYIGSSYETAFDKLGGICHNRRRYDRDPNEEEIDRQMWIFIRRFGEECSGYYGDRLRGWWRQHVQPVLKEHPEFIPAAADGVIRACQDLHGHGESWSTALLEAEATWVDYVPDQSGDADA